MSKEEFICCDKGYNGWCLCIISIPCSVLCLPFYGSAFSFLLRREFSDRFDIVKDSCSDFKAVCLYPCSLFQILVTLEEMDGEIVLNPPQITSVANPICQPHTYVCSPAIVQPPPQRISSQIRPPVHSISIATPVPTMYRITLPMNVVPGTIVPVDLPDGRRVQVQIPPNAIPGKHLDVNIP